MSITVNVQEAKTRLSELLHRTEAGESVIIARSGVAIARLQPIEPRQRSFDQPLLPGLPPIDASVLLQSPDEAELSAWEQGHEGDPLQNGHQA